MSLARHAKDSYSCGCSSCREMIRLGGDARRSSKFITCLPLTTTLTTPFGLPHNLAPPQPRECKSQFANTLQPPPSYTLHPLQQEFIANHGRHSPSATVPSRRPGYACSDSTRLRLFSCSTLRVETELGGVHKPRSSAAHRDLSIETKYRAFTIPSI